MRALLASICILFGAVSGATAQCNLPWDARPDLRPIWLSKTCRYEFPKRDGFAATPRTVWLKPGTVIDRFGQPGGRFLAPADACIWAGPSRTTG
jgi:hypothetical protein